VNLSLVSVLAPGVTQVVLVMSVHRDANGLKRSLLEEAQLIVQLVESGLRRSLLEELLRIDQLVESGLKRSQLELSVSGLKNVQHVDHQIDQFVTIVVQEILVDLTVLLAMTTVSVHSMVLELRLLTRRLSLRM
jgi:hypothetical protein